MACELYLGEIAIKKQHTVIVENLANAENKKGKVTML